MQVLFVVVNGYAVAYRGHPRTTGNLDVFIDLERLLANKRATGRPKDPVDVTEVVRVRRRRKR